MTSIYIDATTLISLGTVGRLGLLTCFEGALKIKTAVVNEVTMQPAKENLRRFMRRNDLVATGSGAPDWRERAREILGDETDSGDVAIIAAVLANANDSAVAVVSDDRRVRTVARGLSASVTGTIGVVVRAVSDDELTVEEAKTLVRELDSHGLHMTGELREKADELIDEAATE